MERVAESVNRGGHDVPYEIVRRRYYAGLQNFVTLYQPLADAWPVYDNSEAGLPALVAWGSAAEGGQVLNANVWGRIEGSYRA